MSVPEQAAHEMMSHMSTPPPRQYCEYCWDLRVGEFCQSCGQRHRHHRLALDDIWASIVREAFNLDRGLLHTCIALFRNPANVIRDYLRGRTFPYTNPVKYFLVVLTVVQLLALWSGATADIVSGVAEGMQGDGVDRTANVFDRFFVLLAVPAVPILAAWQRVLFRGAALHFAEHLVIALFVTAEQLFLWLPALPFATGPKPPATAMVLASLVASTCYYLSVASKTFGVPLGSALLRATVTLVLTAFTYITLLGLVLAVMLA